MYRSRGMIARGSSSVRARVRRCRITQLVAFLICIFFVIVVGIGIVFLVDFRGPITDSALYQSIGDQDGLVFLGNIFNVDTKNMQLSMNWQPSGCGSFFNRTEPPYSNENDEPTNNCGRLTIPVNVQDEPVWSYDPSQDPMDTADRQTHYVPDLRSFTIDGSISIYPYGLPIRGKKHHQYVDQKFLHPFGNWETVQTYLALSPMSGAGNFSMSDNSTTFQALPILRMAVVDATDNFVPSVPFQAPIPNGRVMELRALFVGNPEFGILLGNFYSLLCCWVFASNYYCVIVWIYPIDSFE
ncbi:hypothetical protein K435DRAFT_797664 [Dendrothele bispora CBS 962.96]|uniref:Uncharacterized protein n=1 Tax=Dendrothele bispora (strain CBS 962.96) TaxID=1314807 RepID=A0A4S8M1V2_DENBC|nr:hypothetical protein K435DRAFT_797664 [Dendrothele bispora CBS 962.96]